MCCCRSAGASWGGMAAANGLLNFGLMTAVLVEALRDLRLRQTRLRRM